VDAGHVKLTGRAWSGHGSVKRVEVAVDANWADAALRRPIGAFAWCQWTFDWEARPGEHELRCRATDSTGAIQPLAAPWNYQGMGNNTAQRVTVTVK